MNKPLSCHRNIHFYKKIGKSDVCMYCGHIKGFVTKILSDGTKFTFKPNPLFDG